MPWRARLKLLFSRPDTREVGRFLTESVEPALREVATELRQYTRAAEVEAGEGKVRLVVNHDDKPDFIYGVECRTSAESHLPTADEDDDGGEHARAQVFLSGGGQHYDVYGYSRTQIIRDVLRQYDTHLQWLYHMAPGKAG